MSGSILPPKQVDRRRVWFLKDEEIKRGEEKAPGAEKALGAKKIL